VRQQDTLPAFLRLSFVALIPDYAFESYIFEGIEPVRESFPAADNDGSLTFHGAPLEIFSKVLPLISLPDFRSRLAWESAKVSESFHFPRVLNSRRRSRQDQSRPTGEAHPRDSGESLSASCGVVEERAWTLISKADAFFLVIRRPLCEICLFHLAFPPQAKEKVIPA